jgi:CBS domain-containing protein
MSTVKDLLTAKGSSVSTISTQAKVYEALALMAEKDIGALVVVSEGKVVGVISERDYARKVVLKGRFSKETAVKDVMSSLDATVKPSQTVEECMAIMTEKRHRHLPVMDNGKLVGIISIGDLVKSIISNQKFMIENLENYISGAPEVR